MKFKKITSVLVSAVMAASLWTAAPAAWAAEPVAKGKDYTVTKVSNPGRGESETDGFVKGGDRRNSCAWQLAQRGDDIYIATAGNIAGALVRQYASELAGKGLTEEQLWDLLDVVTNGGLPRENLLQGSNILSYNRKTGAFKVLYTAGEGECFRMAVTFGDNVYFGTYSLIPKNPEYILKLDKAGKFTKVFENLGTGSLRASCVYDGQLFIGGVDSREAIPADADRTPVKMAVLKKDSKDDTRWDCVADYRDFGEAPYDSIMESWAAAPIWELASHNGWLYAAVPGSGDFLLFRGRPAAAGETGNAYGWHWEEAAGPKSGAGTSGAQFGSVFEYKGNLYVYNSDHILAAEMQKAAEMLQILEAEGAQLTDLRISEVLSPIDHALKNPQKLWKLNDADGTYAECTNLTKLTKDTAIEYIWRVSEYDGQMYIATMDANTFYSYLAPVSGKMFVNLSPEEYSRRIDYLEKLIDGLRSSRLQELLDVAELDEILGECLEALERLRTLEISERTVGQFLEDFGSLREKLNEITEKVRDGIDEQELEDIADEFLSSDLADKLLDETLTQSALLLDGIDFDKIVPEALKNETTDKIVALLKAFAVTARTYNKLGRVGKTAARIAMAAELKTLVKDLIKDNYSEIADTLEKIDWDGLDMYRNIAGMVEKNVSGFDLFRTADGKKFEAVTRNGFGDRYNVGCPSLLAAKEGLYLGTFNPFYGGRLYLLAKEKEPTTVKLNLTKKEALVGKSFQLKAAVLPEDADVTLTWKSGNSGVAKVTKSGKVTVVSAGSATVTVTTSDGVKASCEVTGTARKVYRCIKGSTVYYTADLAKAKSLKSKGYAVKLAFCAPGTSGTKVYYVRDARTGHYRYTTNLSYAKKKKKDGCKVGTAFYAAYANGTPVYELVKKGVYRYTISKSEAKSLKKAGYTYKGIVWQAEKV